MFIKKVIAILIAVMTFLSAAAIGFTATPYEDVEGNSYYEDILELTELGIIKGHDKNMFFPSLALTRAEFSQMATAVLNLDMSGTHTYFIDVPPDHWAYGAVGIMTSKGYLSGYEDGSFRPDSEITYYEAISILVRLLGYQYKADMAGGYPYGFYSAALELSLLKGIELSGENVLRRDVACRLINNALDIPLVDLIGIQGENSSYSINKEVTLLTKYLKMKRSKGIVTSNDLVSIQNMPLASENQIIIDGIPMNCRAPEEKKLVGYQVKYTYRLDEDSDVKELVSIRKYENKELTVDRDDFIGISGVKITWKDSDEKDRVLTLSSTVNLIVNGEEKLYDEAIFENIKYGNFTFVSNNQDNIYDVVIIHDYNKMIQVGTINRTDMIITDKDDNSNKIMLDPDEKEILIFNANGESAEFSQIQEGNILLIQESANITEVYISSDTISGNINMFSDEDGFTMGEQTLKVNPYAKEKNSMKRLQIGDKVVFYKDHLGKIAAVSKESQADSSIMYLIDIGKKDEAFEDTLRAKFYLLDGTIQIYDISSNLKVDTETCKNISEEDLRKKLEITYDDAGTSKTKIDQIMLVRLDSNQKVNYMETARGISEFASDEDGFCKTHDRLQRTYISNGSFDFDIYIGSAPILIVPADVKNAEERDFVIEDKSFMTSGLKYTVEAYAYSKQDEESAIIIKTNAAGSGSIADQTPMAVVSSVTKAVNKDNNLVTRVYYLDKDGENYADLEDGKVQKDTDGTYNFADLVKGDTITITADNQRRVSAFKVYYKDGAFLQKMTISAASDLSYCGEVTRITANYCWLESSISIKMKNGTAKVIVVKNNGNVRYGTVDDIEVGDTALYHLISRATQLIVAYKQ